MRNKFFELLKIEMQKDKSIFLIVADMGLGIVEQFQKEFPDRFINVGIAEQNMIGIAAGLCNLGFRPFCYTISNFLICIHKFPITLVGASTGYDNGLLGPTHQIIDDIGCLKILPNMRIYSPATVNSIGNIFKEIISKKNPAYIRIGKGSYNYTSDDKNINFLIEKKNTDILVVTHGTIFENCVNAHEKINNFSIYCMNQVKPIDDIRIKEIFSRYKKVIVVEDHIKTSGLYNSLCMSVISSRIKDIELISIAPPEKYEEIVGDRNYFADKYGFSSEKIANLINNMS